MDGILCVDKPPEMTSFLCCSVARRLLGVKKAGHAGTLDPEAAGVLPVMVGKAARLFDYLQDKEKEYVAEVAFGVATDTQDAQGVPPGIACIVKAHHHAPGIQREGDTSQNPHFRHLGKEHLAHVVNHHKAQGNQL